MIVLEKKKENKLLIKNDTWKTTYICKKFLNYMYILKITKSFLDLFKGRMEILMMCKTQNSAISCL